MSYERHSSNTSPESTVGRPLRLGYGKVNNSCGIGLAVPPLIVCAPGIELLSQSYIAAASSPPRWNTQPGNPSPAAGRQFVVVISLRESKQWATWLSPLCDQTRTRGGRVLQAKRDTLQARGPAQASESIGRPESREWCLLVKAIRGMQTSRRCTWQSFRCKGIRCFN